MCSPATCTTCGKATWTGCGNHIDQALKGVPQNQRCQGHDNSTSSTGAAPTSLFGRVFSR